MTETVTLTIDGQEVTVPKGTSLLDAAKEVGQEVPHYCYHPGLKPDGNCRMCLVKAEKFPKPIISCMTMAGDGMVIDTKSEEVQEMRKNIMEFLLINHPLDCPTCDQAGECRLQNYYMDYDRIPSRFEEKKVDKNKMVDLGKGVMLDEERCIVCRRCVRFCDEVAGVPELEVQNRGDHSMVSTFPGEKMTNPYAGNVVDICPVGALTSEDFRYKKRVWFLKETDSVCPGCSKGCNISIHQSDRKVYRLKPRLNKEVNSYWMCDEGRYDYKFINEDRRLKPGYREGNGQFVESALEEAAYYFKNRLEKCDSSQVAFIASALESNEEIDAFVSYAKSFGVLDVYHSYRDPKNPSSDDILMEADKNPNRAHANKLGLKKVSDLPEHITAAIVQRELDPKDEEILRSRGIRVLALFATNTTTTDELAETIFPLATYAEQNGHFTNSAGMVQEFKQAFEPRGEAKTFAEYVKVFQALSQSEVKSAS
jgi:NADH-quinone oxidoreductase subunit G